MQVEFQCLLLHFIKKSLMEALTKTLVLVKILMKTFSYLPFA
jgi:hypothetical protein